MEDRSKYQARECFSPRWRRVVRAVVHVVHDVTVALLERSDVRIRTSGWNIWILVKQRCSAQRGVCSNLGDSLSSKGVESSRTPRRCERLELDMSHSKIDTSEYLLSRTWVHLIVQRSTWEERFTRVTMLPWACPLYRKSL